MIRLRDKSSSGGAYARDKITSAGLCAKNAGGAYVRGGAYLRDTTVYMLYCRKNELYPQSQQSNLSATLSKNA